MALLERPQPLRHDPRREGSPNAPVIAAVPATRSSSARAAPTTAARRRRGGSPSTWPCRTGPVATGDQRELDQSRRRSSKEIRSRCRRWSSTTAARWCTCWRALGLTVSGEAGRLSLTRAARRAAGEEPWVRPGPHRGGASGLTVSGRSSVVGATAIAAVAVVARAGSGWSRRPGRLPPRPPGPTRPGRRPAGHEFQDPRETGGAGQQRLVVDGTWSASRRRGTASPSRYARRPRQRQRARWSDLGPEVEHVPAQIVDQRGFDRRASRAR